MDVSYPRVSGAKRWRRRRSKKYEWGEDPRTKRGGGRSTVRPKASVPATQNPATFYDPVSLWSTNCTPHYTRHPVLTWDHTVWSLGRFCKTLWHGFCSALKKLRFLRPKFSLGLPAKLPNKCNVWYMILQLWVWRSPKVRAPPWPSFAIPLLLHFASLDLPTAARQEGFNTFLTFLRKVALLLLWRWPSYIGVRTAQGQQLNVMAASLRDQNSRSLFHKQRVWKTQLEFFGRKLVQTRLVRLDGWSAESLPALLKGPGGNFSGCFAFLSRACAVPGAHPIVSPQPITSFPL